MSDKIVVMNEGIIQQVGTPREIYFSPSNRFVADFIGQANFLNGIMAHREKEHVFVEVLGIGRVECYSDIPEGKEVTVAIRPEDIGLLKDPEGCALVDSATFVGDRVDYRLKIGSTFMRVTQPANTQINEGETVRLDIKRVSVFHMNG